MDNIDVTRLLNNTYDEECVGRAISSIVLGNYHYLYNLQKELLDYHRFEFTGVDVKPEYRTNYEVIRNKYCIKVTKEFITTGKQSQFRRSTFYNKLLTLFDIQNSSIFQYNCLVFVNGVLYTGTKIFPTDDYTYIVFDDAEIIKSFSLDVVKITVIIGPNFNIISTATNAYRLNRRVPLDLVGKTVTGKKYQYIHTISTDNKKSDIVLTTIKDGTRAVLTDNISNYFGKQLQYNKIGMRHLAGSIIIRNQEYFSIDKLNMPVTSESMLVFKRVNEGLIFQHNITISSLYPNIFKINNFEEGAEYYILYFYFDDTEVCNSTKLIYDNRFSILDVTDFNLLESYRNDDVPEIVGSYLPEKIKYSIKDFEESDFTDTIDYKDNKLKELIKTDSSNAYKYFDIQVKYPHKIYLDVRNVDLESRIRTSTRGECPTNIVNFRNPHYVFILSKDVMGELYGTRIFIDGRIQLFHTIRENEFNVFIYIPCEFISETSFIEFERFVNKIIDKSFTVVNKQATIDLSAEKINFNFKDIIVLDRDGNIIDSTEYDISILMNGEFIPLQDKFNTYLNNMLRIEFSDSKYNNISMKVKIIHSTHYVTQEINEDNDRGRAIYIDIPVSHNSDNFKIYRNGILVPRKYYDIKFRDNINSPFGVDILIDKQVNDVITVDITPSQCKEVFTMDLIPDNGFIDVSSYIDRPFSLKWYDVYLNGRKLSIKNINVISPTKFFIKNVDSRKNLSIVENNRDEEYFGIRENWTSYVDKLWDEFPGLKEKLIELNGIIRDIEDSLITEEVKKVSVDLDRFYEFYLKNETILNADDAHVPDEIWNHVTELSTDEVIVIDPDEAYMGATIIDFFKNN